VHLHRDHLVFNLKTPEGFLRDLNVLKKTESVLQRHWIVLCVCNKRKFNGIICSICF